MSSWGIEPRLGLQQAITRSEAAASHKHAAEQQPAVDTVLYLPDRNTALLRLPMATSDL
jgi:hypothetical protein